MPPSTTNPQAQLPYFIAYALHRTKLHRSVCYSALVLLSRLKARFPAAKGSSGHRLFISAFMIASKVLCDDTYSNKSWSIVAQGLFALREVNQMEHEMVNYLDFELQVDPVTLEGFQSALERDFGGPTPRDWYPTYPLEMISKRARDAKRSPPVLTCSLSINTSDLEVAASEESPSEAVPPTPQSSYSSTTSPASTPSPETPLNYDNMDVTIEGVDDAFGLRRDFSVTKQPTKKQYSHAVPTFW